MFSFRQPLLPSQEYNSKTPWTVKIEVLDLYKYGNQTPISHSGLRWIQLYFTSLLLYIGISISGKLIIMKFICLLFLFMASTLAAKSYTG